MGIQINNLSQRKLEAYEEYAKIIQWGRRNPVQFVQYFLGIEFLDLQKYVFQKMWTTPFVCLSQCRNSGKSTISAPYLMAKSILVPNFQSYIISTNSDQAHETFLKMEKICKKQIASFTGLTDFFQSEIITSNANKDGFTHKPESFEFKVYNGSKCNTLTSNYDGARGKRSNCNFYDETGFMIEKAFSATEPFTTQDANFKMGGELQLDLEPRQFANQLIYASSASSIDTYFYKKYKEFSKQMFLGNKNYFTADIDCELVLNPMFNGKLYPVALLTQEKIDNALRENKEEALREYYNIFSKEGGDTNPFKRADIMRNSSHRLPMLCNEGNKKRRIVMAYDPARKGDGSILGVAEIIDDEKVGLRMEIINFVNFTDIATKKKIQLRFPEQRKMVKDLILDYNGKGFADYENIEVLMIDAGSGGGGESGIADDFHEDWKDTKGNTHRGLIDKEFHTEYVKNFPNALDKIKLVSPKKYRTELFDSLEEMLSLDLINFTEHYDGKGFIMIPKVKKAGKDEELEYVRRDLSIEEQIALINIDRAKEEMIMMQKITNIENTIHKYQLPSDKSTSHDDRAYVMGLLAWHLKKLRRDNIVNRETEENSQLVWY